MISSKDFNQAIIEGIQKLESEAISPRVFTLSIKKRFDNQTLLEVYHQSFPHVDVSYWKSKIDSGNLTLDGKKVTPNHIVKAGQISSHTVPPKEEPFVDFKIKLVAGNTDYWVISKTSPLPMHAGGRYQNNTLTTLLKTSFPNQKIHVINRLDANTTGIVLVALSKEIANVLSKQFEKKAVSKTYLAIVEGIPSQNSFTSSKQIGKSKTPAGGRKLEFGKESHTDFEILKTFENKSLLQVTPHSGRTNQIRLHLADLGHPIVGDLGYKNPAYFEENPLTYPDDSLFLHAWKLKIKDPKTGETLTFIDPPNIKWSSFI